MTPTLATFFATMTPFLKGEIDADAVTQALGPSPSGTRRVGFYARMVREDLALLFEAMFPSVARAAENLEPGLFDRLVAGYLRAHPPSHWDSCRAGERFSEFLGSERLRGENIPEFLEELADFHDTKRRAALCLSAEGRLEETVFVRQYSHEIPDYADADCSSHGLLPAPGSTIAIIYRSTQDLHAYALRPSIGMLLALVLGSPNEGALRGRFPEVTDAEIQSGRQALVREGVLEALRGEELT